MLEHLIEILNRVEINLTPEEIADALWLAQFLPKPKNFAPDVEPPDVEPIVAPNFDFFSDLNLSPLEMLSSTTSEASLYLPQPDYLENPVVEDSVAEAEAEQNSKFGTLDIRVAGATALPDTLAIERILRLLKRRVFSRRNLVLDDLATVQKSAEFWNSQHIQRCIIPVLRPAFERWLDITVIIDQGTTMQPWQETIKELLQLLRRHIAFRKVNCWFLQTNANEDNPGSLKIFDTIGREVRNPKNILSRTLQQTPQAVLVVSDCVGAAWETGLVYPLLNSWSKQYPVTILQVLPRRLWRFTALADSLPARFWSYSTMEPNIKWKSLYGDALDQDREITQDEVAQISKHLRLSVVALGAVSLGEWVYFSLGRSKEGVAGYLVAPSKTSEQPAYKASPKTASLNQPKHYSARDRVNRFSLVASKNALELVTYLSLTPVSLAIARIVQKELVKGSAVSDLAEVFMGGLFVERTPPVAAKKNPNKQEIIYDFYPGVREILQSKLSVSQAQLVLDAVSLFVDRHSDQPRSFAALLVDMTTPGSFQPGMYGKEFAKVTASYLKRLGGQFNQMAERMEYAIQYVMDPAKVATILPPIPDLLAETEEITVSEQTTPEIAYDVTFVCTDNNLDRNFIEILAARSNENGLAVRITPQLDLTENRDTSTTDAFFFIGYGSVLKLELDNYQYKALILLPGATEAAATEASSGKSENLFVLDLRQGFDSTDEPYDWVVPQLLEIWKNKPVPPVLEEDNLVNQSNLDAPARTADDWVEIGRNLLQLQKPEEALEAFDQAIKINAEVNLAWLGRGKSYIQLQEYTKAIESFTEFIRLNPFSSEGFQNRGLAYIHLKNYQEAEINFNQWIFLEPENGVAYSNLAAVYLAAGEYRGAALNYELAIKHGAVNDAAIYINFGNALIGLKDNLAALSVFTQAVDTEPTNPATYYHRGRLFNILARYTQAIEDLTLALIYNPHELLLSNIYLEFGKANLKLDKYKEAFENLDKFVQLEPFQPIGYYHLGEALTGLEDYVSAVKTFTKAIELDEKLAVAIHDRGVAYYRWGVYENAKRDFDRAISLDERYVKAYYNLGNTHRKLKNLKESRTNYNKAIDLFPDFYDAHCGLGLLYYDSGNYDAAIDHYTKAITIKPGLDIAYFNRALAYVEIKNYNWAIADLNTAISSKPAAPYYYARGQLHIRNQAFSFAIHDFEQAIYRETNPTEKARYYLQRAKAYLARAQSKNLQQIEEDETDEENSDAGANQNSSIVTELAERAIKKGFLGNTKPAERVKGEKDLQKALTSLDIIEELVQENAETLCLRGKALYLQKFEREGEALFLKALNLSPNDSSIYTERGLCYYILGKYDKALADLTQAIKLEPKNHQAYNYRLLVYQAKGKHKLADADSKMVSKLLD